MGVWCALTLYFYRSVGGFKRKKTPLLTDTDRLRTMRPTKEPARPDTNRAPHPGFARIPANRASALASNACDVEQGARASAFVVRWELHEITAHSTVRAGRGGREGGGGGGGYSLVARLSRLPIDHASFFLGGGQSVNPNPLGVSDWKVTATGITATPTA